MIQWGMRQSAEMENLMTSVERILEYGRLESEAPLEKDGEEEEEGELKEWPREGRVAFDRVTLSYGAKEEEEEGDEKAVAALREVTFETRAAEKVSGIFLFLSSSFIAPKLVKIICKFTPPFA